jgi:hypothetical protein
MVVDLLVIIKIAMSGRSGRSGSMIAKRLRELELQQSNETAVRSEKIAST